MEVIHVSEIENLKPESVAFISYIVNQYVRAPYEMLMFQKVDVPFLKVKATHVSRYGNDQGDSQLEFWIIDAKGLPSGIAIRVVNNGVVDEDQTSFANFVIRPYHQECVVKAISELPTYER